jgi:alpha-L-rhamnosidase
MTTMKKLLTFLLLSFCFLAYGTTDEKKKPSGLMVEFIREPSGVTIMDLKPEFSWIVPEALKSQSAYRIIVASSKENISRNTGDIWDSGKVKEKRSAEMEFAGAPLLENTGYYWKIMVWDEKNKPSDFSEPQSFRTGSSVNYLTTRNKFVSDIIEPVSFKKTAADSYFIDFGKDAFGTLLLNINPVADDTLIIHLGEKLSGEGKIDRLPGGTIRYQKILLPVYSGIKDYTLNLPKDNRNTGPAAIHLPDSFGIITPFRYCEVEKYTPELKSSDIKQKIFSVYFDDKSSSFSSNDTILNQIWNICKYSMKATSFAGIYVDGDRERIPYEADAYINQLGHYYTDREYSIARLTNEHFIDHPTWPTEWILHTVPMFWNDFMFTGNIESMRQYYSELKNKTLTSLAGQDGLITVKNCTDEIMESIGFANKKERLRDIVDWPPSQKDTGWKLSTSEGERDGYEMVEINTVVNAFYYNSLLKMSEISVGLGFTDDSEYFKKKASQLYIAFNEHLLDKQKSIYVDGISSGHSSLHANMMALAFGLVPEENKKSVIQFIKSRKMACSVYAVQYLLEGLYREGESEYAFDLLTSTDDRSWWNMIRSGSTITLEAWDMKYKPNSDWNHAWGAAPANIIPGYLWGISPVEPGYTKAIIKPQPGRLLESKISVPTIRGNINAEFKVSGRSKQYSITIPGNMKCDFVTGASDAPLIILNGKKIKAEEGVIKLNPGINKIILREI